MGCTPSGSAVDVQLQCRWKCGNTFAGGRLLREDEADGQEDVGRDLMSSIVIGRLIEFKAEGKEFLARITHKRAPPPGPENAMLYQLEYVNGHAGTEWVDLDESQGLIRSQFSCSQIPYRMSSKLKPAPMDAKAEAAADAGAIAIGQVIEFVVGGACLEAKVVEKRVPKEGQEKEPAYRLEYIQGRDGTDWVDVDEGQKILQSEFTGGPVQYFVMARAPEAEAAAQRGGGDETTESVPRLAVGKLICFEGWAGKDVTAVILEKKTPMPGAPENEPLYHIEYVEGNEGTEWVDLDETRSLVRALHTNGHVPFHLTNKRPSALDGDGKDGLSDPSDTQPTIRYAGSMERDRSNIYENCPHSPHSEAGTDTVTNQTSGSITSMPPNRFRRFSEASCSSSYPDDQVLDDDEEDHANDLAETYNPTVIAMRSPRRRRRRRLAITDTMGVVPSKALQMIINNRGDINSNYKVEPKLLGAGNFGTVRRATVRATNASRAVKAISKSKMKSKIGVLKQEVEIMKLVDHPNLVMLYEIFESQNTLYLVMELCDGGHLQNAVSRVGRLSEPKAAAVMQQIFRAVYYLHRNHICHRDIKSENCLLSSNDPLDKNIVKVSDFGLSCVFRAGEILRMRMGTLSHMAPEVLSYKYNHMCDAWSCGVVLYFLLSGCLPFPNDEAAVKRGTYTFGQEFFSVSTDAVNLITTLLSKSVRNRCSAGKALTHTWVKKNAPKAPPPNLHQALLDNLLTFRSLNRFKRASLQIVASMLGEEHIAANRAIFTSMDTNGDGLLSVAELRKRVADVDGIEEKVVGAFKNNDTPDEPVKDFTYTEFLAATFDRKKCLTESVCKAAFVSFDKNGDGSVSMSELASGRLLGHLSLEELAQTLEDIDANADSVIDFVEYVGLMLGTD